MNASTVNVRLPSLRAWRRNKVGFVGGILVVFISLIAVFAPWVAPGDPSATQILHRLKPPSSEFKFGTDNFGRDILSRIIYGARVSLQVGFLAVAIGVVGGIVFGLLSGYYGGWVDQVTMRIMDVLFAFPSILLALVVVATLGSGLTNVMIAIGITYVPVFTRVVRSAVLSLRESDFIAAEVALGASDRRILLVHVLPNITAPIIVQATLAISGAVLTEATLSFLGLGIQPPAPSWGSMLSESRRFMELAPWTAIFPASAIMVTVMSFNLFGDGLRDVLDPKLRR